jgi:hypothetical protein
VGVHGAPSNSVLGTDQQRRAPSGSCRSIA